MQTDTEAKCFKAHKSNDESGSFRKDDEADSRNTTMAVDQNPPPPKQGFIHVRARRGQATDSHSLAERVIKRAKNSSHAHQYPSEASLPGFLVH